ncbi:hypothetical protein VPNG_04807 [Cytospora leucostoma]|uniref:Sulphur transport domain-containing protein n=1 Tax=Cytospora leucostoma TaxID=1230097 RepID=A0A423XBC5_9PEZI|nr:hypothetical protein VPNG_04807 [Cytospora leucostoma]
MMNTVITGAAFGAALVASGMYSPYLIASQLSFDKWNMFQTFLTATGCSALSIEVLKYLGRRVPPPRSYSTIGLFGPLDGNIIGGAMLGAGMSLSASCPGVVFPQLALGVPSAPTTMAGATFGGIFWSTVLRPWIATRKQQQQQQQQQQQAPSAPSALHPVAGGLAVGLAQLTSLLLRGRPLGVSTCYEQLGDWATYLLASGREGPRPAVSSLVFSGAMMAGARALAWVRPGWTALAPAAAADTTLTVVVSPLGAFVGGFLMAVGSRVGGGCTSGHGISGMGLMSVSSFVSIFATFAAAAAVSWLA